MTCPMVDSWTRVQLESLVNELESIMALPVKDRKQQLVDLLTRVGVHDILSTYMKSIDKNIDKNIDSVVIDMDNKLADDLMDDNKINQLKAAIEAELDNSQLKEIESLPGNLIDRKLTFIAILVLLLNGVGFSIVYTQIESNMTLASTLFILILNAAICLSMINYRQRHKNIK